MKSPSSIRHALLLVTVAMPLPCVCMEKYWPIGATSNPLAKTISIRVADGMVPIKERVLAKIGRLLVHYEKNSKSIQTSSQSTLFPNVTKKELLLFNEALEVRPDWFGEYYCQLSQADRDTLINLSDKSKKDPRERRLCVPQIAKLIMAEHFKAYPHICEKISGHTGEKNSIFAHCLKATKIEKSYLGFALWSEFAPKSVFMSHDYSYKTPLEAVSLPVYKDIYPTYATQFMSKNIELRITNSLPIKSVHDNAATSKECLVWIIDHDHSGATVSAKVSHHNVITGYCFGTIEGQDYIITYSDKDMVFSCLSIDEQGAHTIQSRRIDIPEGEVIVDVCIFKDFVVTISYGNLNSFHGADSILRLWNQKGVPGYTSSLVFDKYGLFKHIFVTDYLEGQRLIAIASYGLNISTYQYDKRGTALGFEDNPSYWMDGSGFPEETDLYLNCIKEDRFLFIYNPRSVPVFRVMAQRVRNKQNDSFMQNMTNYFSCEPDNQFFHCYSPDGKWSMRNYLTRDALKMWNITTQLWCETTHQPLLTIDTLFDNFICVGFSHNSKELIFRRKHGSDGKIIFYNDVIQNNFNDFEELALSNLGISGVVADLIQQYNRDGYLSLDKDDPIRHMLLDWSKKSPEMLDFLKKCFPFNTKKH